MDTDTDKNKDNKRKSSKKNRKHVGLYIIFGVALVMILYYLVFINGVIAS